VDDVGREAAKRGVDEVIVQSGSLTGRRFRKLLDDCASAGASVKVLPGIDELLSAKNPSHVQLRRVEIKDLLRREPVQLDDSAIRALVEGRTVMVTGAGGSIGSEICRQVLRFGPWSRATMVALYPAPLDPRERETAARLGHTSGDPPPPSIGDQGGIAAAKLLMAKPEKVNNLALIYAQVIMGTPSVPEIVEGVVVDA
jgi:hypothetical protein